jgi:hypothetical protein
MKKARPCEQTRFVWGEEEVTTHMLQRLLKKMKKEVNFSRDVPLRFQYEYIKKGLFGPFPAVSKITLSINLFPWIINELVILKRDG